MNLIMNAKRTVLLVVAALVLLSAPAAQAFYNPHTGRWLSRDPIAEQGLSNLLSLHQQVSRISGTAELHQGPDLYTFVRNIPTSWIDTDGREAVSAAISIEFGSGTAAGAGITTGVTGGLAASAVAIGGYYAGDWLGTQVMDLAGDFVMACKPWMCAMRGWVVQIGNENNVLRHAVGIGTGMSRSAAIKAAWNDLQSQAGLGERIKHVRPPSCSR